MLTTIKGIYDNGQIILEEAAPTNEKVEVLVTFSEKVVKKELSDRAFGSGKGMVTYMAEDFNDPLDDLKDYM
jgi:hypothetical protein